MWTCSHNMFMLHYVSSQYRTSCCIMLCWSMPHHDTWFHGTLDQIISYIHTHIQTFLSVQTARQEAYAVGLLLLYSSIDWIISIRQLIWRLLMYNVARKSIYIVKIGKLSFLTDCLSVWIAAYADCNFDHGLIETALWTKLPLFTNWNLDFID